MSNLKVRARTFGKLTNTSKLYSKDFKSEDCQLENQVTVKRSRIFRGLTADELLRPTLCRPSYDSSTTVTTELQISQLPQLPQRPNEPHKPKEKTSEEYLLQCIPIQTVDIIPVDPDELKILFDFFRNLVDELSLPFDDYMFWIWTAVTEPFLFLVPRDESWTKPVLTSFCHQTTEMCCYLLLQVTGDVQESMNYLRRVTPLDLQFFAVQSQNWRLLEKVVKHYAWIDGYVVFQIESIDRTPEYTYLQTKVQQHVNENSLGQRAFKFDRDSLGELGDPVQIRVEHETIYQWLVFCASRYLREVEEPTKLALVWTLDRCLFGPAASSWIDHSEVHLIRTIGSYLDLF